MNKDSAHDPGSNRAVAARLRTALESEGFPPDEAWDAATPVTFCSDWQGRLSEPGRETEVKLLWTPACLLVRFRARYRGIYVYPGGKSRRDRLWLRDVAEVFVRPGSDDPRHYREFEVSPNGDWLDLEISPGRTAPLMCDLKCRATLDQGAGRWVADLAIPMTCLTREFDPREVWRVNFFRVEGAEPDRFYSAWRPTRSPQPNFHVPEAFGEMIFSPE